MKNTLQPLGNQDGFVLVVAMMIMTVLSLLGIAGLETTTAELQISGNDRNEKTTFYGAESGCWRGGQWLRNLQSEIIDDYIDDDLMKDFLDTGDYDAGKTVRLIGAEDESNLGDADYTTKYSYEIGETLDSAHNKEPCKPIPGNNENMLSCFYKVACSTPTSPGVTRSIEIQIDKPTDFK